MLPTLRGLQPSGSHTLGPFRGRAQRGPPRPSTLWRDGWAKRRKHQFWSKSAAKVGHPKFGQSRSNKDGQSRFGQSWHQKRNLMNWLKGQLTVQILQETELNRVRRAPHRPGGGEETDFGQSRLGHLGFGPANLGQNQFWPIHCVSWWSAEGWGSKISRFFSPLAPIFALFVSLWGVFSWNFGCV